MNWTINRKLVLLSLLNLLAIIAVAVIGYHSLIEVLASGEDLVTIQSALRAQGDADMMHDAINSDVLNVMVMGGNQADVTESFKELPAYQALLVRFNLHRQSILRAVNVVEKNQFMQRSSKQKIQDVYLSLEKYITIAESVINIAATDFASAKNRLPAFTLAFGKLETDMAQLSDEIEKTAAVVQSRAKTQASSAIRTLIVTGFVAALLVTVLAILMARSIVPELRKAVRIAKAIAEGDLRHEISATSSDEVGALMQAFRDMSEGLNKKISHITSEVARASQSVLDSAKQLSIGNETLANSTEAQASTVEEAVAGMEQLASNTKHNTQHAEQISEQVREVSHIFRQGNEAVGQLASTMTQINSSSKRIAEITALIDGIAFQTNILALNASVEAARAGESGRGFSVVATEVRNLAQRSSDASKEIKALIDAAVEKAEAGSSQAEQTRRSMEASQDAVTRVTTLVLDIANASKEQSEGIEEMNEAIVQIDQVTQQNAALVEESAAATELLQEDAARLVQITSVFLTASKADTVPQPSKTAQSQLHANNHHTARSSPPTRPRELVRAGTDNTDDWQEF